MTFCFQSVDQERNNGREGGWHIKKKKERNPVIEITVSKRVAGTTEAVREEIHEGAGGDG